MQSDHRTIHITLPGDETGRKRWTPPARREIKDPTQLGEAAENSFSREPLSNLENLDKRFAEIATSLPKKAPRKKASQDPGIQELIQQRMALQRSPGGRQRFQITAETRKLITKDTRSRRRAAIKEAFAGHTNWTKIALELRVNRPMAAPIFKVNGKSITSEEEAITAMANHIKTIYAKPTLPVRIPPWDT